MRQYLVFTLAAPLASFGTLAVGERRPTWDRPSKSQVIGTVAAALGIERADEAHQHALARSFGFAVRIDDPGQLLTDYHTTQRATGPSQRRRVRQGLPLDTRHDELLCDEIETGLSRRELRENALYTIVLWAKPEAVVTLVDIAAAMAAPGFVLYAGRKANALQFPCGSAVVNAKEVVGALEAFDAVDKSRKFFRDTWSPRWMVDRRAKAPLRVYCDADGTGSLPVSQLEERRDIPDSRAKWRFSRRTEALLALSNREAETP